MKGLKMHTLKKTLLTGAAVAGILVAAPVWATGWLGVGLSSAGLVASVAVSLLWGETIAILPSTLNIDPVQLGLEAGVYAMKGDTEYEWDPEPEEEYEKAAESNGGSSGTGGTSGTLGMDNIIAGSKTLSFQVASLTNVGIESIGVGPDLSEIASSDTRTKILGELSFLQPKSSSTSSSKSSNSTGAGSCSASYSVCLKSDMTDDDMQEISERQNLNQQLFGTAAITHAELGLKSVQQAIVNDGGSIGASGSSASNEKIQAALSSGGSVSVQGLTGLIGQAENTVWAMKVVAAMNLELAQRLNQGNMLQGSTLTIEAARALKQTSTITD